MRLPSAAHDRSGPIVILLGPVCSSFGKEICRVLLLLFTSNLLKLRHSFIMPRKSSKLVSCTQWVSVCKSRKMEKASDQFVYFLSKLVHGVHMLRDL